MFRTVAALLRVFGVLVLVAAVAPSASAADAPTAQQEEAIRESIFEEDENGRPGVDPDAVDEAFAAKLYGSPNALGVLQKVFTEPAYSRLNQKLGALRQTASLQIWAEIASETGLRIELNNAGKTNGALSDLDITFYADADHFPNDPKKRFADRSALHDELARMFTERWSRRFNGVAPDKFDHMHFKGSDVMLDWRTSQAHWTDFKARLDADISTLSQEEGAYYIPGAYKPQVYGRYLSEGKAYVIEPDADAQAHGDGFPDGVKVVYKPTRDVSLLYRKTRMDPDRTAQLEAILHNHQWATHAASTVKNAKYSNRETDGLRDLTNLEADFRRLILEGRDQALRYNLDKLFQDYEQKGLLPPEISSVDEMERVIRMLHQIEFDKVLGASGGSRPRNWDQRWRSYEAKNPNAVETKLETYFQAEADEIRRAFPDMPDAMLAERAEAAFREKAKAITRLGAHKAASRLFSEVFTEDGLRQLRHRLQIKDNNTARRLVAERVRGLHAALVFQDDPRMIQAIRDAAPAEALEHVDKIVEIARAQRAAVLEHEPEVRKITTGQLQESDEVIRKLLVRLGLGEVEARQGQLYNYWRADEAQSWARMSRAQRIKGSLMAEAGRAYDFTRDDVRVYANSLIEFDPVAQSRNFVGSFWDLGTVDAAAKVTAKLAAGDVDGARIEARDAVLENVPIAGDMVKLIKAQKEWLSKGDWFPAAKLFGLKAMGSSYIQSTYYGPAASTALAMGLAVYSIEKSLYDLGWYMAGKPTQNHALSIALMGDGGSLDAVYDCSGFGGGGFFEGIRQTLEGWKSSRFQPNRISEREWNAIQSAAILEDIVEIPNGMPREVKEYILKTQYMGPAIREAFACGHGENAERTTIIAENYFREIYLRSADYWLRRALFYDAVHLDFFAWNDRIHPGRNFHLLSEQPPLAGMTKVQQDYLKNTMPDVWDPQLKLWDHERYWLRRYIREQIVSPWREKIPEVSEFIYQAETLTGDFEKALEDELVTYYLEGERLDLQSESTADTRYAEQRRQADATIDEHADEIAQAVLAEQGKRQLEQELLYEKLRWAPKLVEQFTDAMAAMVASAPEHQPQRPTLQLAILRPAARDGGEIPFRFFLEGDITLLPASLNEFTLSIVYEETGETLEERFPAGVNEWDVRRMFGKREGPEGYDFTKYNMVVTLAYEGPESITLEETAEVWLATVHEEDEDESEEGEEEPGAGPEEPVEGEDPGDTADTVEGTTTQTRERCREAAAGAAEMESGLEESGVRVSGVGDEINAVIGLVALLRDVSEQTAELADDAQAAAQSTIEAKQRAGDLTLQICETALHIKQTTLAADISADLSRIKTLQRDLIVVVRQAEDGAALAKASADKLDGIAVQAGGVEERLRAVKESLREAREAIAERRTRLEQLRAVGEEAAAAREEAEAARSRVAEALEAAQTEEEKQAVEAALGRISAVAQELEGCAGDMTARSDAIAESLDAEEERLNQAVARLLEAIRETPATLLSARIDEASAQARSAADVAEAYLEAVLHLRQQAGTCGRGALDAAKTRITAEARERVRECDFPAAEALIKAIPPGVEQSELERSLAETRKSEGEVDALVTSAKARLVQVGCPSSEAMDDLRTALGKTVCEAKRQELADLLADAENAARQAGNVGPVLERARELVARCAYDEALEALDGVDVENLCPEAVDELEAERSVIAQKKSRADEARGLIQQAAAEVEAGNRDQAEASLVQARTMTDCPAIVAAADEAIANLPEPEPEEPVTTARPEPDVPPGPPGPEVEPPPAFYVVYKHYLYGPRGINQKGSDAWPAWTKEKPPEDASEEEKKAFFRAKLVRFDRWVRGWTLGDVEPVDMFSLSSKARIPGVFRIDAPAQINYPREKFEPGAQISSPMNWSGRDSDTGAVMNIKGGLLMEVIAVYDDPSRIKADYPSFDLKNIVPVPDETGMFTFPATDQGSGSGGPLAFGWTNKAKREALTLSKSIWVMIYEMIGGLDCYLTSVVYGHPDAPAIRAFQRLRDEVLRQTPEGRKLSAWYYAEGPHLAQSAVGSWMADALRPVLDRAARWIEKGGHRDGFDRALLDAVVHIAAFLLPEPGQGDVPSDPFSAGRFGLARDLVDKNLPGNLAVPNIAPPSSTPSDSRSEETSGVNRTDEDSTWTAQ